MITHDEAVDLLVDVFLSSRPRRQHWWQVWRHR